MKLLLATEGSPDATTALRSAGRLFRNESLEADVLCVVPRYESIPTASGGPTAPREDDPMVKEADRLLGIAVQMLRAQGVEARPVVEAGSPADVILRRSADYDVAVIGAHDRFGRTQPGVGPVASQVIARRSSALLVGRELINEFPARVLFCADGSPDSERALTAMIDWIRLDQAEVDVIHVVETPWLRFGLDQGADGDEAAQGVRVRAEFQERGEAIVDAIRAELDRHGVGSMPIFTEGIPELQILSQVDVGEYDLIVVGATGVGDIKHAMLGSVSIRVAQNAPASVLVV